MTTEAFIRAIDHRDKLRAALVNAEHYLQSAAHLSPSHHAAWLRARAALGLVDDPLFDTCVHGVQALDRCEVCEVQATPSAGHSVCACGSLRGEAHRFPAIALGVVHRLDGPCLMDDRAAVGPGDDKRGSVGADPSITDVGASPAPEGERVDGSRDKREPDYSVTRPGPASVDAEHEHVYVGTCWCGESAPDVEQDEPSAGADIGWYISDTHARRAIGYLTASVPELGRVSVPWLSEKWGEALERTMLVAERSPIGPEAATPSAPVERAEALYEAGEGLARVLLARVHGARSQLTRDQQEALVAWDTALQKAYPSQGCAHAYTEDANGPVCGKCGERG